MKHISLLIASLCACFMLADLSYAQSALSFDGSNDFVDLGSDAGDGIRTVELWFQPKDTINNDTAFNFISLVARNTTGCQSCSEFSLAFKGSTLGDSARLQFRWNPASTGSLLLISSDNNVWNAGQWYHVAGVLHPDSGMMMFVDGIKQADIAASGTSPTPSSTFPTSIGRWGDANIRYFNGSIDDVRFSDTARYKEDFVPPCPDLINDNNTAGLWNLNDGTGSTASDASSNNYDGTINSATWSNAMVCESILCFDGVDDYIDLGDDAGDGIRTVELWFKPTDTISNDTAFNFISLVARNTTGCQSCSEFSLAFKGSSNSDSARLQFRWRAASGGALIEVFSDGNVWNAGQWYHVAGVLHPTLGMMMFIDGSKQIDIAAGGTNSTPASSFPTSIGRWGDADIRYFEGCIDDVRFSDTARYANDFVPPCPDLINDNHTAGLWNMNKNNGIVAYDSSSNGFDGDIYGATWDAKFDCRSDSKFQSTPYTSLGSETLETVIYPNPGDGNLNYKFRGLGHGAKLYVYDIAGHLMMQSNITASEDGSAAGSLQMNDLRSGVYLINIVSSSGHQTLLYTRN